MQSHRRSVCEYLWSSGDWLVRHKKWSGESRCANWRPLHSLSEGFYKPNWSPAFGNVQLDWKTTRLSTDKQLRKFAGEASENH